MSATGLPAKAPTTTGSSARLLFIGGGKMGRAIIEGLLAQGHDPARLTVIDPALPDLGAVTVRPSLDEDTGSGSDPNSGPDGVVLAIKPQIMAEVLPALAQRLCDRLLISIAAGKSLAFFQGIFGAEARVVRAMPNLPAAIGAGMTGWISTPSLSAADRALTQTILAATGQAHELKTEDQIDAWTAIAGSGPAYVFHFLECLSAAAQDLGFDPSLSDALAQQTVLGAAQLADQSPESFATLRENVTSPGGTTAAGLQHLSVALAPLTQATARAAYQRAKELAEQS